jgi:hypothetical protein
MKHGNFVFEARPSWEGHEREVLILALTPGIPFEWIIKVTRMGSVRKAALRRMIEAVTTEDHAKAEENAASITEQDGFRMLKVIPHDYRGAIPLYAQLWLQSTPQTDAEVARILGVKRERVCRWRNTNNFDPLTGVRIHG